MTDVKKVSQTNVGINPVVAAMAGAVVAGVAVAGAMAMSDKNNQIKVKKVIATGVDKVQKLEGIAKNTVNDVKNV